jgi:hypothetical protein
VLYLLETDMTSSFIFTGLSIYGTHVFPQPSRPDMDGIFHKRKTYEVLTAALTKINNTVSTGEWLLTFRKTLRPPSSGFLYIPITVCGDFSILRAATDCLELNEYPRLATFVCCVAERTLLTDVSRSVNS